MIGSTYIYPEGSSCIEEDQFQLIQREICKLPEHIDYLLMGDTNSRVNLEIDWIPEKDGVDGPLSKLVDENPYNQVSVHNYLKDNNMLERRSLDTRPSNKHGPCLINLCKTSNLFILNGRFDKQDLGLSSVISKFHIL